MWISLNEADSITLQDEYSSAEDSAGEEDLIVGEEMEEPVPEAAPEPAILLVTQRV